MNFTKEPPSTEVFKLLADIRQEMASFPLGYLDRYETKDKMVEILTKHMINYGKGE